MDKKTTTAKKPVQKRTAKIDFKALMSTPVILDIDPKVGLKIMKKQVKYKDAKMFLHCQHCLSEFIGSDEHKVSSPSEAMSYEAAMVPFTYPDGTTVGIMAVFCKKCGRQVWDSRHLTPLF